MLKTGQLTYTYLFTEQLLMHEHIHVGVDYGPIWLSWDENVKYGTWPLLLPSSASYMMTIGGQVGMNC